MTLENDQQGSLDPEAFDYWTFIRLAMPAMEEGLDDPDLSAAEVVITLNRATTQLVYDLEAAVHRPMGTSWSAFRLLFVLWLVGPLQPGRAAKLTGMGRAAVSQLARTLVDKGLVSKVSAPDDARTVLLNLTEEGRRHTRQAYVEQNRRESKWVSSLTDVEQKLLVMLLQKLMSSRDQLDFKFRE